MASNTHHIGVWFASGNVPDSAAGSLTDPAVSTLHETVSYGELWERASRIRKLLMAETAPGELIALLMPSTPSAIAALLASRTAGRSALLLPPALPEPERSDLAQQAGIRYVLDPGTDGPGWPSDATVAHGTGVRRGTLPGRPPRLGLPHGVAQLTSGSLGASRLALRPWEGIDLELEAVAGTLGLRLDDVSVCVSSIAHSYGLMGGVLAPLAAGARVVLAPLDAPHALIESGPTVLFGLADSYGRILRSGLRLDSRIRFAFSAGAPLPPGLYRSFLEQAGTPIRQDYGTTETGTISLDTDPEVHPDTVGTPMGHVAVRIGRPREAPLDHGEQGEIQVRSAALAAGYLTPEALVPLLDAGWYQTGDAGTLDEGRRLRIGRRLRTPIHRRGETVRPELVERSLLRLPGVREVAVVALVCDGEPAFKAVIATDLPPAEVERQVRQALPPAQRPSIIETRAGLPRSPAGKVLQKYLM